MPLSEQCWFCGCRTGRRATACEECGTYLNEQDEVETAVKRESNIAEAKEKSVRFWWGGLAILWMLAAGYASSQGAARGLPFGLFYAIWFGPAFAIIIPVMIKCSLLKRRIRDPYTEARRILRERHGNSPPRKDTAARGVVMPRAETRSPARPIGRGTSPAHPASNDEVGLTCPYDQAVIKPGEAVVTCPACGAVHHAACWQEMDGCAACGNR